VRAAEHENLNDEFRHEKKCTFSVLVSSYFAAFEDVPASIAYTNRTFAPTMTFQSSMVRRKSIGFDEHQHSLHIARS
jgi:hypothetical protein